MYLRELRVCDSSPAPRCSRRAGLNSSYRYLAGSILTVVALLLLAPPASAARGRAALAPGDRAPDLRGYTPAGDRIVTDFKAAGATVVNFWATWCEPCRDEMPELQRLAAEQGEAGLRVIGVLVDQVTPAQAQQFLDDLGIAYPNVIADMRLLEAWGGIRSMPASFLVDSRGIIRRRYIGATPEQVEGLVFDAIAVLEGRQMGTMIIPETPAVVTDEDRPRAPQLP